MAHRAASGQFCCHTKREQPTDRKYRPSPRWVVDCWCLPAKPYCQGGTTTCNPFAWLSLAASCNMADVVPMHQPYLRSTTGYDVCTYCCCRKMKSRKPCTKAAGQRSAQTAPHLPDEVIVNILRHVTQEERLSSCALVCTAWATAAAAATSDIYISEDNSSPEAARSLVRWLLQHAQPGQVQSIVIPMPSGYEPNKLVLYTPHYTRLHTLQLDTCTLQLFRSTNSSQPHILPDISKFTAEGPHVLPALRQLSLKECTINSASLAALSLPKLTSLALDSTPISASKRAVARALTALCQRMPELRQLQLTRMGTTDAALAQLSCLQRLESFSIDRCWSVTAKVLSGLCSGLMHLDCSDSGAFLFESLPEAGWPCLRELHLDHIVLQVRGQAYTSVL